MQLDITVAIQIGSQVAQTQCPIDVEVDQDSFQVEMPEYLWDVMRILELPVDDRIRLFNQVEISAVNAYQQITEAANQIEEYF